MSKGVDMTWKPTEEMVEAAINAIAEGFGPDLKKFSAGVLIAVQPLIVAQFWQEADERNEAMIKSLTPHIAKEAVEKFLAQDYSATVAALVDGAAAEARAKALEEAAKEIERLKPIPKTFASIAELEALLNENDPSPVIIQPDGTVIPDFAAAIRSLIPKPPERT